MPENNKIEEYDYHLPENKIAKFPLEKRDESKLLVYKDKRISESKFKNIVEFLPENSLLLFNDTKVISARLIFRKSTGARIEIFLLEPVSPFHDFTRAMDVKGTCVWKCTIGNKRKWKEGTVLEKKVALGDTEVILKAGYQNHEADLIQFSWDNDLSFADIIQHLGSIPIPPYLEREDEEIDKDRYQTVYSQYEGAVAAPTAGLHFTEEIITSLQTKKINHDFVTLHVSAGTFKPVQAKNYLDHDMHREQVIIRKSTLENLIKAETIICVGTTSLRTLESLYWMGIKKMLGNTHYNFVEKLYPYSTFENGLPSGKEALKILLQCLIDENKTSISGETEIFIFPGYDFKLCSGLITNFHLPKSTLLLLIAAFIGADWKKVYANALDNDFRFLSYGDSSLLMR